MRDPAASRGGRRLDICTTLSQRPLILGFDLIWNDSFRNKGCDTKWALHQSVWEYTSSEGLRNHLEELELCEELAVEDSPFFALSVEAFLTLYLVDDVSLQSPVESYQV